MFSVFEHYNKVSMEILKQLFVFSQQIMCITTNINHLLEDPLFHAKPHFKEFVNSFREGRYYHFRCQGYMECLVVTKSYSPFSISYWLYQLVYPAVYNFETAIMSLDQLNNSNTLVKNKEFCSLLENLDVFKKTSEKIMNLIQSYHL